MATVLAAPHQTPVQLDTKIKKKIFQKENTQQAATVAAMAKEPPSLWNTAWVAPYLTSMVEPFESLLSH